MENKKWKLLSALLALLLVITIGHTLWKKHQTEKAIMNEFVLNVAMYAQYAVPTIEEFEKTRDQAAFAERMENLREYLDATYRYTQRVLGDISPEVENYNRKIVDPLYFRLSLHVKNAKSGVIGKTDMEQLAILKEVLHSHDKYIHNRKKVSLDDMRKQLDKEVNALKK